VKLPEGSWLLPLRMKVKANESGKNLQCLVLQGSFLGHWHIDQIRPASGPRGTCSKNSPESWKGWDLCARSTRDQWDQPESHLSHVSTLGILGWKIKRMSNHQAANWLVVLTSLKNMKVNGTDYPIYYGK